MPCHRPSWPLHVPLALQFLRRKWDRELDYRLRKYLWAFMENRISVCFEYEYHDARWGRYYHHRAVSVAWNATVEGSVATKV